MLIIFITAVVAVNLHPNIVLGKDCNSCLRAVTFTKHGNWSRFTSSDSILVTKARTVTQCSLFCLRHYPKCQSIHYDKVSSSCELMTGMEPSGQRNTQNNDMVYGINFPKDCGDILKTSQNSLSGVYEVSNDGNAPKLVYCDMDTDDGGWTVFQRKRRMLGRPNSLDFNRPWVEYKNGFGNLLGEFWLGNDFIHKMTSCHGEYKFRLDMETTTGENQYTTYAPIYIADESDQYKLELGRVVFHSGRLIANISAHLTTITML
ncbi:fibrinogen-like protein A isoform X2 [Anneissia japonica]|uniref:fibrinogen-like protein A isoform X2 n=1 Tax=Anneissia japonica TaxID=1529436 RepID=UPI001425A355|nr:fibrinogen-like protein A isoform X2 [Anneissia japonica]